MGRQDSTECLRSAPKPSDPANPNKLYVYVQNQTDQDIAIDHLRVNTEIVGEMKTIPAGQKIAAGKKTCVIIYPHKKLPWGSYCGVGAIGKGGEQVAAVVRVINLFPIGSWSVDTRTEMFFDSIDLRKPMLFLERKNKPAVAVNLASLAIPASNERPGQAYYDGRDPTCDDKGLKFNSRRIIASMSQLAKLAPSTPYYTHLCKPSPIQRRRQILHG